MSKFKDWTDDEIEQLGEDFEICWAEGIGPSPDIAEELIEEIEERDLETFIWAEQRLRGEPIDDED